MDNLEGYGNNGQRKGIKIKNLSLIIALSTAIISVLLFVGMYLAYVNYKAVLVASQDYVGWQENAHDMIEASDLLTEKARDFVETGNRQFIYEYFLETDVTRTREKSLNYIRDLFGDSNVSSVYALLERAYTSSVTLMQTEYYAMRLKIESDASYDLTEFHQAIQNVELDPNDAALSPEDKGALAREKLFNTDYLKQKNTIINNTNNCIDQLSRELAKKQTAAEDGLRFAFIFEIIMIVLFIGSSTLVIILTSRLVFDPLIRSIHMIKMDAPMPAEGARELRILADTYNAMYVLNHKEKSSLKFSNEHDPLTGALNRRALDKLNGATENGKVALMLVDIDNFKRINDTYGHPIGDKILKNVVAYLRLYLRPDDRIFRIGGDEFAVVMFGVDESATESIREKIIGVNKTLLTENSADVPPVSLSVGVAFGNVIDQALIEKADEALYDTKQSGKAGISFHEDYGKK